MKKLFLILVLSIGIVFGLWLVFQNNAPQDLRGEINSSCFVWDARTLEYLPMIKACGDKSDCETYLQTFTDHFRYNLSALDLSRVECKETIYEDMQDQEGRRMVCGEDGECFNQCLDKIQLHSGDLPPAIIKNIKSQISCESVCRGPKGLSKYWEVVKESKGVE